MKDDLERRYIAEMTAHAKQRVEINIALSLLGTIVATLQLALRHPEFPVSLRAEIESFIGDTIGVVSDISPSVAEGWARGNEPSWDIPRPVRRGDIYGRN